MAWAAEGLQVLVCLAASQRARDDVIDVAGCDYAASGQAELAQAAISHQDALACFLPLASIATFLAGFAGCRRPLPMARNSERMRTPRHVSSLSHQTNYAPFLTRGKSMSRLEELAKVVAHNDVLVAVSVIVGLLTGIVPLTIFLVRFMRAWYHSTLKKTVRSFLAQRREKDALCASDLSYFLARLAESLVSFLLNMLLALLTAVVMVQYRVATPRVPIVTRSLLALGFAFFAINGFFWSLNALRIARAVQLSRESSRVNSEPEQ